MTASEISHASLERDSRRAYEGGRLSGGLWRGAAAAAVATPAFLVCNLTTSSAGCLLGLALVVIAGRVRGEDYWDGARAGATAGIIPCLFPGVLGLAAPDLCSILFSHGAWICGIGGAAAGVVLGFKGRFAEGARFWAGAVPALGFAASLGCIPAGALGFAGLAVGMLAGAAPVLASRRVSA